MMKSRAWGWVLGGVLACLPVALTGAERFGDIEISLETMPVSQPRRGYQTLIARMANRDTKKKHGVRLVLQGPEHGVIALREVSRQVEVGAGAQMSMLLPVPLGLPSTFQSCAVEVDGYQEGELGIALSLGTMRSGRHGHGVTPSPPEFLVSQRVSRDAIRGAVGTGSGLSRPGLGMVASTAHPAALSLAERTIEAWPGRWSAYSAYDVVVITDLEWRTAPESVRDALWRHAECGAVLAVIGDSFVPPVACRTLEQSPAVGNATAGLVRFTIYEAGLGRCAVFGGSGPTISRRGMSRIINHSQRSLQEVWERVSSASNAHSLAPVLKKVRTPLGLSFIVLAIFALVAGPINLMVLRRKNRGIWLFWITPVLGLATSLMVIVSVLFGEGLKPLARIEGMTILDERAGRATTIGINGFYCPLRPRKGLAYSYDTEVTACLVDTYGMGTKASPRELVWDEQQHLRKEWVAPRVPQYFRLRTSELRKERLGLLRDGSQLAVVNGLGVTIERLVLVDFDGTVYEVTDIPEGDQVSVGGPAALVLPRLSAMSDVILRREQWKTDERDNLPSSGLLRPGTYLAYLEGAPFVPNGLQRSAKTTEASVVFGILREETQP
ncbi:MAG: hypothetical protein HN849_28690 [Victivallales bacterium]|nr:hypothetical protein [Victivallales bacterium]